MESQPELPEELEVGQRTFHRVCGNCHGPDAKGGGGAPDLTQSSHNSKNFPNERIKQTILNGSASGAMASQKDRVNKREIEAIIQYIRHLQKTSGG